MRRSGTTCLRENIVKNHGIANSSGMKFISLRWLASTGSWNAVSWENLLKYSLIIAELSFKKNHCKYFGMNLYKLRNARSGKRNDSFLNLVSILMRFYYTNLHCWNSSTKMVPSTSRVLASTRTVGELAPMLWVSASVYDDLRVRIAIHHTDDILE